MNESDGGSPPVSTVDVRRVERESELADALAVRRAVFIDEQGVPPELEVDEYDTLDGATHFVAVAVVSESGTEEVVGAARLRPSADGHAKAERVAVRAEYRGQGLGARLMDAVEAAAEREGFETLVLHAQSPVEGFYEKRGYQSVGEEFEEAGIPHVEMVRDV